MAAIITLPGVLSSVPAGMEEAILLEPSGMVSRGLQSLFLFTETSGTTLNDAKGGAAGAIDNIASSNNAFSRLSGGGLQLSGAQLGSFPAFEANAAWTLFTASRTVNHTGSAGTEKIAGLVGLRNFGAAQVRGSIVYQRGATNLSASHSNAFYEHRPANGAGGNGPAEQLSPLSLNTFNVGRLIAHSYNGTDTITSTVYDKDGTIISTDQLTTTASAMFTISGVTVSNMQWCIGGVSGTFAGGVVQHELSARYNRALSSFSTREIQAIAAAAAALGASRGRAW